MAARPRGDGGGRAVRGGVEARSGAASLQRSDGQVGWRCGVFAAPATQLIICQMLVGAGCLDLQMFPSSLLPCLALYLSRPIPLPHTGWHPFYAINWSTLRNCNS